MRKFGAHQRELFSEALERSEVERKHLQVKTVVIAGLIQRAKSLRTAIHKEEGLDCQGKQENAKARQEQETRDSAAACLAAFRG